MDAVSQILQVLLIGAAKTAGNAVLAATRYCELYPKYCDQPHDCAKCLGLTQLAQSAAGGFAPAAR